MKKISKQQNILPKERYILNKSGNPEYVVLPINKFRKMLNILEDYGLGKAIKEVSRQKKHSLEKALKLLDA